MNKIQVTVTALAVGAAAMFMAPAFADDAQTTGMVCMNSKDNTVMQNITNEADCKKAEGQWGQSPATTDTTKE